MAQQQIMWSSYIYVANVLQIQYVLHSTVYMLYLSQPGVLFNQGNQEPGATKAPGTHYSLIILYVAL